MKRTPAEAGEDDLEEKPDVIKAVIPEIPDHPSLHAFPIGFFTGE